MHFLVERTAASLWRRLLALFYDALLVLSLWFFITLIGAVLYGEALPAQGFYNGLYSAVLVASAAFFYAGFVAINGQTLGMKAWRICVLTDAGNRVSLGCGLLRFFAGLLGFLLLGSGWLVSLWRSDRKTWHDVWTHSQVVRIP